jgi:hypothetical protein
MPPRASATGIADAVPQLPSRLDGEEHEAQQERLERDLERDSPELEQPRCRAREDHGRDGDRRVRRPPIREPAEQEHGGEHARRREPARDLAIGSGDDEDTRQPVHEERALVVPEGSEVEREARAVLVTALRRDRVGVVGDGRLVAEEAGRIRGRDPHLERRHRTHCRESQQEPRAHQPTARSRR